MNDYGLISGMRQDFDQRRDARRDDGEGECEEEELQDVVPDESSATVTEERITAQRGGAARTRTHRATISRLYLGYISHPSGDTKLARLGVCGA